MLKDEDCGSSLSFLAKIRQKADAGKSSSVAAVVVAPAAAVLVTPELPLASIHMCVHVPLVGISDLVRLICILCKESGSWDLKEVVWPNSAKRIDWKSAPDVTWLCKASVGKLCAALLRVCPNGARALKN